MKFDAQQAVEIIKDVASENQGRYDGERAIEIQDALAALDGKHVYVSPFKPGQKVWPAYRAMKDGMPIGWKAPECPDEVDEIVFDEDGEHIKAGGAEVWPLFPTRELAEAEAERRNKERER